MMTRKTITCSLYRLTKKKLGLIDEVYSAWQDMTKEKRSYSENRCRYPRLHSKYPWNASRACPNDPLDLDTQHLFEIIKTDNKIEYFVRITVRPRMRIFCPIKIRQDLEGLKIHSSKLIKRNNHYDLHLAVSKEISLNSNPSSLLSVDLGEKIMATAVLLHSSQTNPKPVFMGRIVRGLRRHYAYLRKKLGQKKLQKVIDRIGNIESRKVNDILHKISREIVNIAKANNAAILIGDLTGIRRSAKGKKMNRIVASMPFYKLARYITYKANWEGIPVVTTKEWYSSRTCSRCGSDYTSRPYQGLFKCNQCNYEVNADFNGAKNLGKRLMEYIFVNGTVEFRCENRITFCDPISYPSEQPKN